jgi:hypothetical protein
MTISVAFTASRSATKSFRASSACCASRARADFVITLGLTPTPVFAPNFFLGSRGSLSQFTADESAGVLLRGVGTAERLESASSSSSNPNESFPLFAILRFFLNVGWGVVPLYFVN